ncbi:MAG: MFS transporter [Acidimicrobiia bacterium]
MRTLSLSRLLAIAILVVTISTQAVFLLGAAFVQIGPEFDLGPVGLGALTAAFFLTASATSSPLGRWIQRVGWQTAMIINTRVSAVLLLLIAVAARTTWSLAALLIAAAAVYGAANPAANQALADHTNPKHRATIFGLKHAGIPGSTLLAGLAVPLIVVHVGWRWAYVAAAGLALVVSLLIPRGPIEEQTPDTAVGASPPVPLSTHQLIGLATGSAFATWGAIALATFLVSAAVDLGFSAAEAGLLQFAGSGASIGARIIYGVVTDHSGGRGFGLMAAVTLVGAATFGLLVGRGGALFSALILLAFATGWGWPGLMTFTVVNANRSSVAASSAITQAGVFVGAGLGPLLLGAAIERWSFSGAWITACVGLLIAALVVGSVGKRTNPASSGNSHAGEPK